MCTSLLQTSKQSRLQLRDLYILLMVILLNGVPFAPAKFLVAADSCCMEHEDQELQAREFLNTVDDEDEDEDEDDEDDEEEPKDPSEIALDNAIDGLNNLPRAAKARMERLVALEDEFDAIHLEHVGKEAATEALAYRAECQRRLGRSRLAREGYQQYLNLDSGGDATALALHGLGHCLQDTLEWNRALDQFEKVIREFPDHDLVPECHYDAGYCLREMGDYSDARAMWDRLISRHGSTSAARKAGAKLGTLRPPIERLKELYPRWEKVRKTFDALPYAERTKGIKPVEDMLAEFGDCRAPETEAFLTRLLKDKDKEIQAAAAVPLLNIGGSGVTRTVLTQMKKMSNAGKKKVLDALRPRHLTKTSLKPIETAARSGALGVSSSAVELLGRVGDLPATKLLVDLLPKGKSIEALQGQQRQSYERILRALRSVREEAALDWLLDKVLDREKSDLLVRVAVAETLGRAGHKKAVDTLSGLLMHPKKELRLASLKALALLDDDSCVADIVRASRKRQRDVEFQQEAVRALCRLDPTEALEMLLALGNQKDVALRTLVITALSRIDGEISLVRRIEALEDPAWQVRSAALAGLRGVRDVALVDALLQAMRRETGSLLPKVVELLIASTGVDLGPDPDNWDKYWARERDRYDPVAISELAGEKHGGKTYVRKADPGKARTPSYFGVEIISKRIAFVIDCSGSMAQEVTVPKEGGGVETMNRLELAKSELRVAIEKLRPGTHFNLVRFDNTARPLHDRPKKLSPKSVKDARQFIDGLQPGGGTNIYDSLEEVLTAGDIDTIFFLSDGAPSAGTFVDPNKILEEIGRLNEQSQVTIHTIALGFTSPFMQSLAEQNRGSYIVAGQ
ncbi:MAG: hypothetical protein CBC13_03735 [Planctomycetia bacterium TMED53]|nr:MAG: hypothetical protein CBC13_03735 [Planctomycetia bacterium TMED53]